MRTPEWLKEAVFYEIYPPSFLDSNGDGIGDLNGIRQKLGYVRDLGCNALWLNPCFDSPFRDGGYDIRDFLKVAPRYGTNEELIALFSEAHALGMHVLLDLVPGHTSEEHPWFLESAKAEKNAFSDRYVWTDHWIRGIAGYPYVGGEHPRSGTYMPSFFKFQPALNYGWREPSESWQSAADSPEALATRDAIAGVMRFWLSLGCDGFRVDMADSLVKGDDAEKSATCSLWRNLLGRIRAEYPDAAFVSEWSSPKQAILSAEFDMDFYLEHAGNGYNRLIRAKDSYVKGGDPTAFLADYLPKYEASRERGFISFITGNHDTPRISDGLTDARLRLAYALLFTLPGVPFLYYGDEIGMRYLRDLPTKEGGYDRTGSRTPMQWTGGPAAGFSSVPEDRLYLPTDPSPDAPHVIGQEHDTSSLLSYVKALLALRRRQPSLRADAPFEAVHAEEGDPLFLYRRGQLVCAANSSERSVPLAAEFAAKAPLFTAGTFGGGVLGPLSFAVL